ncbi:phosphatase and actin regulator 3a [Polypterus senegalus]|uniref:phosphatase and actin regulator 3a n=1 Tax=Polypterus senegalus TaxID=55291 RepID=UPI0019662E65|nr:phosphatase and actin regulator 3a [Polypterus senegalus]
MAESDGVTNCVIQRGRSQSDPNILTESSLDHAQSTGVMDQQRALHSGCLVSGVRTPPIRRNSKLATLGRIFKPWKWRKKKNEKLKQNSTALERKVAMMQTRDELVRKELVEIMEKDSDEKRLALASGINLFDPDFSTQDSSDGEEKDDDETVVNLNTLEDMCSEDEQQCAASDNEEDSEAMEAISPNCEELPALPPAPEDSSENEKCAEDKDNNDTEKREEEEDDEGSTPEDSSPTHTTGLSAKLLNKLVSIEGSQIESVVKVTSPPAPRNSVLPKEQDFATKLLESHNATLRGQHSTPTGSPHLGVVHVPLPPSRVIEELHRALATKHRQDSFHGKEVRGSPKRRNEGRLSRTSSADVPVGATGDSESKVSSIKASDENKENVRVEECWTDASGLPHDQDSWNESVISGTLPRKMRKELLAVKLRNRPSKQELEDRNIFPVRSDEERQEIRQQIEMKLSKRLSQRPAVEELESRNILKQRNDQTEQEERREIKQRLNRKLNQRPTVDELRDRKILIRFSDYVEVAKAQDYDRRADKPWTRLSAADKAAIRKELNEYKSNEMEVHASSKHLTRFHRP